MGEIVHRTGQNHFIRFRYIPAVRRINPRLSAFRLLSPDHWSHAPLIGGGTRIAIKIGETGHPLIVIVGYAHRCCPFRIGYAEHMMAVIIGKLGCGSVHIRNRSQVSTCRIVMKRHLSAGRVTYSSKLSSSVIA
ncbi:hypothetical protein D3C76_376940 [compost metagenome]